jgi:hypothetical protein
MTAYTLSAEWEGERRRHDVAQDSVPEGGFDLIHTRLVLIHILERDAVVERLASALRPGGWLLLEEQDTISTLPNPELDPVAMQVQEKVAAATVRYIAGQSAGGNQFGRRLVGRLLVAGLTDIGAECRAFVEIGGPAFKPTHPLTHPDVRAAVVAGGEVTDDEVEAFLALRSDPNWYMISPLMVAAWGRRPMEG